MSKQVTIEIEQQYGGNAVHDPGQLTSLVLEAVHTELKESSHLVGALGISLSLMRAGIQSIGQRI